jgi:hypothetical protein
MLPVQMIGKADHVEPERLRLPDIGRQATRIDKTEPEHDPESHPLPDHRAHR